VAVPTGGRWAGVNHQPPVGVPVGSKLIEIQ